MVKTAIVDRKLHMQTSQHVLKGPDLAVMRYALSLWQQDMHYLVGLITGHVALNRHLKLVGIKDSSICPFCSEEEETALHFFGKCPALATIRQRILGMHPLTALELGKVKFLNLFQTPAFTAASTSPSMFKLPPK